MPNVICRNCGEEFYTKNNDKWCQKPECREARYEYRNAKSAEAQKKKHKPRLFPCANCGEMFRRNNSLQIYCNKPECREAQRLRTKKQQREWHRENRIVKRVVKKILEEVDKKDVPAPRICRKCKRPIKGPNYFYCNNCLSEISSAFDNDCLYSNNDYPWVSERADD